MHDTIRFLLGDAERTIAGVPPTRTVLEWLRGEARACGTKEGCAEGDCGACTVVLGEPDGDAMRWRAVNACILFVPALDGRQLLTVEHLRDPDGTLHPVQQAMVAYHGSQCGFCTPGFMMSLFALYHAGSARTGRRRTRHWPAISAAAPAIGRSWTPRGSLHRGSGGPVRRWAAAATAARLHALRRRRAGSQADGGRFLRRARSNNLRKRWRRIPTPQFSPAAPMSGCG